MSKSKVKIIKQLAQGPTAVKSGNARVLICAVILFPGHIDQGSKGLDNKYVVSAATIQLSHYSTKAA